jgi:hypothetical protein
MTPRERAELLFGACINLSVKRQRNNIDDVEWERHTLNIFESAIIDAVNEALEMAALKLWNEGNLRLADEIRALKGSSK